MQLLFSVKKDITVARFRWKADNDTRRLIYLEGVPIKKELLALYAPTALEDVTFPTLVMNSNISISCEDLVWKETQKWGLFVDAFYLS